MQINKVSYQTRCDVAPSGELVGSDCLLKLLHALAMNFFHELLQLILYTLVWVSSCVEHFIASLN